MKKFFQVIVMLVMALVFGAGCVVGHNYNRISGASGGRAYYSSGSAYRSGGGVPRYYNSGNRQSGGYGGRSGNSSPVYVTPAPSVGGLLPR